MRIGNVDFVAWVELSDSFENMATLLWHTYDYNGLKNGILSVQYGNGEEYDLTVDEYESLTQKYPNWNAKRRINHFYQKICEKQGLMLVEYEQLQQLESFVKKGWFSLALIDEVKKDIFMSMKMFDPTIRGLKESEEYKISQAYNKGLRDALAIFQKHIGQEEKGKAPKGMENYFRPKNENDDEKKQMTAKKKRT